VALLSQREDITEEEANQIADQIESYRNSIVEQLQKVQQTSLQRLMAFLTATTSTRWASGTQPRRHQARLPETV